MKRIAPVILLLLLQSLNAEYFANARFPLAWLSDDLSVRAAGMGRAFTGLADDPSAVFFNPAGLGLLGNDQILLSHRQGLAGVDTDSLVLTHRAFGGNLAYSVLYLHAPDLVEIRSGLETGRKYNYQNGAGMLSYGRKVWRWINAGISLRYGHAAELNRTKQALSADLAVLGKYTELDDYLPNFNFASLGVTVQNVFLPFGYPHQPAEQDLKFRMGLALRYMNIMTLTFDLEDTKDRNAVLKAGYEIFPFHFLALRAGYVITDPSDAVLDRFTFGAGIGNRASGGTLSLETSLRWREATGFLCEAGVNWAFNDPRYYISMKDRLAADQSRADRLKQAAERKLERKELRRKAEEEKKEKKAKKDEKTPAPAAPESTEQPPVPEGPEAPAAPEAPETPETPAAPQEGGQ